MISDNFTFAVNFYNTPDLVEPFLKSIVFQHPDQTFKICVSDNSTDSKTKEVLEKLNLKFLSNPGMIHSLGVDELFKSVSTPYMILCDSDILFRKSIEPLIKLFLENEIDVMGELQGPRGGYSISPRISPHFCIINLKKIKELGIKFHNQDLIDQTNSHGFHGNIPLQINDGQLKYDVGSAFYQACLEKDLRIASLGGLVEYISHTESLSWAEKSGVDGYISLGKSRKRAYIQEAQMLDSVDISGRFIT